MAHAMYMPELNNMSIDERELYLQHYVLYIVFPYTRKVVDDMILLQYFRKEMKSGDRVYINSISCTTRDVNTLRKLIRNGELKPDEEILRKCVVDSAVHAFMDYIKQ